MKINIPTLKPYLPELLKASEIWLVGGAVRDSIINQDTRYKIQDTKNRNLINDFDFAIMGSGVEFARKFAKRIKGTFVLLDKENDEGRVVLKTKKSKLSAKGGSASGGKTKSSELTFDFNGMKSIEEDLRRRDFTINTIAAKLPNLEILDTQNGIKDIKNKTIRMVSAKNITDDPLRIMRAFRLGAVLDFKIEPGTMKTLVKYRKLLKRVAGERVREEFFGILRSNNTYKTLGIMAKNGILQTVIPETRKLDKTEGKLRGTLTDHSILTVKKFEEIAGEFPKYTGNPALLKLACLLHDIGKPYCYSKDKVGNVHFYGHEKKGIKLLGNIRDALKLSNSDYRSLSNMILYHMRPHLLATESVPTTKAVCRLVRDGGEDTPGILLLAYADALASGGKGRKRMVKLVNRSIKMWEEMRQPRFKRLINGNDLIKLGFTPGPLFKEILQTVEELQMSKELTTYNQAITYIKKNWSSNPVLPCALAREKKKRNNTRLQPKS